MSNFNIIMPKLGESVQEATITKWFKKVGDTIQEEDVLLEIATDKVDSEIPSPVDGKIIKILFAENSLVPVGEIIAIVETGENLASAEESSKNTDINDAGEARVKAQVPKEAHATSEIKFQQSTRFYSPLVQSIAKSEGISIAELESIQGTGHNGRVNKNDLNQYLTSRDSKPQVQSSPVTITPTAIKTPGAIPVYPGDEIVPMDRMRRLIAENMIISKQTSAHVTSFIEADVTNLVLWRNRIKEQFAKREKQKLTFMPVFIEATAIALKEFRGINASVDGDKIILRKDINIGIAVALPSGNLIVPVIRNADQKSILGLTTDLNTLAGNARNNKLNPDDVQGGTFTITNFGSFGNLTGTPIINQPQVAILATGTIEKKPVVLETPTGDVIAVRHRMMLALTYDHRIVDGALGGAFLQRLAGLLGSFDLNRSI
jgi:2-oxoglutarate dehydrogenase E2 component (dihydrolipoamide succinyltransferase)